MTGFELKLWQSELNWTQERAAEEFGFSMRTYIRYEQSKPPRAIVLAIQALSMFRKLAPFFSFRSEAKEGDRTMSFISSGSVRLTTG